MKTSRTLSSGSGTLTRWPTIRDSWRGSKPVSVAIRDASGAGRLLDRQRAELATMRKVQQTARPVCPSCYGEGFIRPFADDARIECGRCEGTGYDLVYTGPIDRWV